MTAEAKRPLGQCRVAGKLRVPVAPDVICAEIERAIASEAPAVHYSAEITVLSPSRLTAKLVVEGRVLPLQNFAVMDQNLSESTIKRFASSVAAIVAKAAKN